MEEWSLRCSLRVASTRRVFPKFVMEEWSLPPAWKVFTKRWSSLMTFLWFSDHFPMIFLCVSEFFPMCVRWFPMSPYDFRWFSYGFLMLFLWCSYCFPIIFLWFSEDFLWLSHDWQRFSDWFAHGFPVIFLMVFRRCVMHFYESPMFVVRFSDASLRIFQRLS